MLANPKSHVDDMVNSTGPPRGRPGVVPVVPAAQAVRVVPAVLGTRRRRLLRTCGLTQAELKTQLQSGKTLAAIVRGAG